MLKDLVYDAHANVSPLRRSTVDHVVPSFEPSSVHAAGAVPVVPLVSVYMPTGRPCGRATVTVGSEPVRVTCVFESLSINAETSVPPAPITAPVSEVESCQVIGSSPGVVIDGGASLRPVPHLVGWSVISNSILPPFAIR